MKWADEFRTLGVRTNADTPEQATNAVAFGAEGVGLCRTEHMFFEGDRIDAMREMILAGTKEARARAVAKLLPYQRGDFIGIFTALKGLPATIRFLDPPLHEFLPSDHAQQNELANKLGVPVEQIARRVHELHEFNPMLGHRGCRLGIVYPEISEMQARAIFEAAADVQAKGIKVRPEIMIPLVGFPRELKLQIDIVRRVADEVAKERKTKFNYLVGTMIEIPRAALVADLIARDAEFFSYSGYESVCVDRSKRRWALDGNYARLGTQDSAGHQAGNLRRTRRRTHERQILSPARSGLRELQPISDSDCTIGSGPSRAREINSWSHLRTSERRANALLAQFTIRHAGLPSRSAKSRVWKFSASSTTCSAREVLRNVGHAMPSRNCRPSSKRAGSSLPRPAITLKRSPIRASCSVFPRRW